MIVPADGFDALAQRIRPTESPPQRSIAISASSLLDLLKSLFAFDRPRSRLRPLIRALRARPYDLAALEALRDELAGKHRDISDRDLWRILRSAEGARATPGDTAATPLIDEIWRGALWEVQARNRAT